MCGVCVCDNECNVLCVRTLRSAMLHVCVFVMHKDNKKRNVVFVFVRVCMCVMLGDEMYAMCDV